MPTDDAAGSLSPAGAIASDVALALRRASHFSTGAAAMSMAAKRAIYFAIAHY